MEIKINISSADQNIKELKESHTSDLPSLISAISRIKESTNSFLTEVINNNSQSGSGDGNGTIAEDDEGDGDDEDEEEKVVKNVPMKQNLENSKRKSTSQDGRKRLKT